MSTLMQDLRYGLRMLAKTPLVSSVAAVSLALGIAANAAMFAILNGFMFEPLPFGDQDGLVLLREGRRGESLDLFGGVSMGNFRDYEVAATSLAAATAYTTDVANLTGVDVPEQLRIVVGTPNIFDVLRVQPTLGRGFRPDEGAEGVGNVMVLDHDFWQRRFFGDPDVLGRAMTVDGQSFTVVGVMPEAFDMIPADVQAFRPSDYRERSEERATRGFMAFGRLTPGATPERVQQELDGVVTRLAAEYPDENQGYEMRVMPARDFFPGSTDTQLVTILTAVTLFGLLIACANVANLLLGRAEERQREVAVRTALGAGRHRILRQLLTESVTLGLVAGALGIALAALLVRWLRGVIPAELPRVFLPQLDAGVLVATVLVSILAGAAFGLVPALHSVRTDLREALGEGSRGGTVGRRRKRLRSAFVVGEFAVALGLLTGAAFMMEAFDELTGADPGFRQEGLLTFSLRAADDRYPQEEDLVQYQDELLASLGAIPGAQGVAAMSSLPRRFFNPSVSYEVAGRERADRRELPAAGFQAVNPEYFATMEIEVLQGRNFEETDRAGGQRVAIVNQAFARREFPDEDPLSRTVTFRNQAWVVVGVVGDILQARIPLAGDRGEAIYVPVAQAPLRSPSYALRVAGDPTALAGDVRQAVWAVNPDQPVALLRTLDAHVAESLAGPRAISIFLLGMGAIALLLAAMGIYGVMAHSVAQQQREIGIRMALGAGRRSVVGMVTRSGLGMAGVGMLLGLPLAFVMYRVVASALNLFESAMGVSYAAWVTLALALVAVLSTWLPARRASSIEPVAALKES
jgi:putative ABC transport system permease protein